MKSNCCPRSKRRAVKTSTSCAPASLPSSACARATTAPICRSQRKTKGLIEAATDLGCPPLQAFWKITFPLSLPGVIAGCLLVFIPAVGEFVLPDLLGGTRTLMIGKVLWDEFFLNSDWPLASAVAVCLLVLLVGPMMLYQRQQARSLERP